MEMLGFIVRLVVWFHLSIGCTSTTGFIKDQSEDLITFPPTILPTFDSPIPVGHLRPLGWQRSPSGKVPEYSALPDPESFYEQFVLPGEPVVFRNATMEAPAIIKWQNINYFRDKYGSIDVHVVTKKELLTSGLKRMKLESFLKEFRYADLYLSNFIPLEMMEELILPKALQCGFRKWLMESEIWMSSGGTASLLHAHADHDLHCLLAGRKDFIFVHWNQRQNVAFNYKDPYNGAGYSEIDMDQINMFKYPKVAEVPWTWATLRTGDCVFVPAAHLHQVRSYGLSISSTNHFAPTPEINFADCDKSNVQSAVPLSEAGFLWTYANGQLLLSNSRLSGPSMRHHLLMVMRDSPTLTFAVFEDFYKEVMQEETIFPDVRSVWINLASDGSNEITRQQLKEITDEALHNVADAFNIPHNRIRSTSSFKHEEL